MSIKYVKIAVEKLVYNFFDRIKLFESFYVL